MSTLEIAQKIHYNQLIIYILERTYCLQETHTIK